MASKQGSAGPSQGKQSNEKKKPPKKAYNQKNYKSSPNIPFVTDEKSHLVQIKAHSKPSASANKSDNTQNASKQSQSKVQFHIEKTKGKTSSPVDVVSPQFMSLTATDDERKLQQHSNKAPFPKYSQGNYPSGNRHPNPETKMHYKPHQDPLCRQPQEESRFPRPQRHFSQQGNRFPTRPHFIQQGNRFPKPRTHFIQQGNRFPRPAEHFNQHGNRFPRPVHFNQHGNRFQIPSGNLCQQVNRFQRPENHFKYAPYQNNVRHQEPNQFNWHKNLMSTLPSSVESILQNTTATVDYFRQNTSNISGIGTSIPNIKYKKKKTDSKNLNVQQKKKTNPNSRRQKTKKKKIDIIQEKSNEMDTCNIAPLLSFQKLNTESEKNFDLIEFSDDDDFVVSQDSIDSSAAENFNLIDFSNDDLSALPQNSLISLPNQGFSLIDLSVDNFAAVPQCSVDSAVTENFSEDDSDSSDESDESEVTSELSMNSSIDTFSSLASVQQNIIGKEAFISVFWDIENCGLPSKKSVVDFASYVRQAFYEGRSEDEFAAACDVSKLNNTVVKELEEASVTLMHISSLNKNAADKKIQSCLRRFQHRYHNTNSAVVLISSDSDFTQDLHDMRYKHHIFINLICSNNTKRCLMIEANKCEFFENIIQSLPDRSPSDNMEHILLARNLPQMKRSIIKKCLSEKLKSFNCRVKVIDNTSSAEILFQDRSICNKAMISLKGYYLGGNAIDIIYQEKKNDAIPELKKLKDKQKNQELQSSGVTAAIGAVSKISEVDKESSMSKSATLCVFVSTYVGDTAYWETTFKKTWNNSDFWLQWQDGNYLLIHFKSLNKAQKAKKVLQKNQLSDENAPKFFKLIKHEDDISLKMKIIDESNNSIDESNKNTIAEHVQIVERKTQSSLKKHQYIMNQIRLEAKSELHGASLAVLEKLKECSEQMDTFKNYSKQTLQNIKGLNISSENFGEELKELLCNFIHECNSISSALPIYAKKEFILQKIREHQVIVIRAETGSGKSTQLTQYMWKERNLFKDGVIICTQPRKIAAISLAKHVSSQIGSKLGDIVGYQVGLSNKMSVNTRISYVTDFTMLKMLVGEGLNNVSCIIIDEAHERTIYTDILLGMIKRYLPSYPRLKIVITSATIDTSIFRDYFNLAEDAVLHIAGRTFPVEDIWLHHDVMTPTWDYFSKTVDKAVEILSEEPGDILCFLTTPLETEKAVDSFHEKLNMRADKKNVKVLNLHGKLDPQEQQKVFEKTLKGSRKVIFATNCAETSITIPGIKYVIDCGMVKESKYDATRNMNVLSVGFVSKSSAEQRRGRAGRTQVGKCYHLYSKSNYDNMVPNTDPEILRINLGQALLKLMKMGISDPTQFDFVQSPPKDLLNLTMKQLLHLKAVDENNLLLTDLGNKMAILPLEPRLCHLIFQGIDNCIGYEAVALAALLTTSSNIFYRNTENKDEADKKKRRFCESENDFLTYLEVYKEWVDYPKHLKSQFCVVNCINARSMRIVHELINEIVLTLQKELSYKMETKFEAKSYDTLIKVIFHSYSQNLSVFSGHYKFGYKSLNTTERLLIHPSSALCAFGHSTPQFVIYDTILKTSQTFIVNVCPVTKDMILSATATCGIEIDLKALEDLIATEFHIGPLGEKIIINHFIGKKGTRRKYIQNQVKELTNSDFVEIDTDVAKGMVKIFGYGSRFDEIPSLIEPIINDAQEKLVKEENDMCFLENSSFTAILIAEGYLKDVILPGEFRDIKVILKGTETMDSVLEKLLKFGPIKEIREWKNYFKVTFEIPASAQKVLESCNNEIDFAVQSIHKHRPYGKDYRYKVFVTFLRRKCKGIAYITTEPQMLRGFTSFCSAVNYKGHNCSVFVNKKTNDLCVKNLPPDTDRKDLEPLIKSCVLGSEHKITKFAVIKDKAYESSKAEMDTMKDNVLQLFSEFTFRENIEVELKPPKATDFIWNATVYFRNPLDGETAVSVLKSRESIFNFAGGIVLKPVIQTFLYCKPEIFSAVKDEINKALEFFKSDLSAGSLLDITAFSKGTDKIEIKIISNNVSDFTDARRTIHTILAGDEINFSNNSDKEKLFTETGKELLKKLVTDFQDCYISQNIYNKTISLFGKVDVCNNIKREINSFLKMLENQECKDIILKTDSGNSVLKELLKLYGYDLNKLKEECNMSDMQINKYRQILTIQGNSSSVSKCEGVIQNLKETLNFESLDENADVCPVCYDEVSEEKHRLEYCGHAYCKECLLHLLQNSDVPLKCEHTSDDMPCDAPVVLADMYWAWNGRNLVKKTMLDKFLRSFVESRDDISYCPTPDCPMIFRVTEDKMVVFTCPACSNDICTRCKESYHCGLTCSLYQCLKSNTVDTLMAWMKDDPLNRKQCPSCLSGIEKNGGCNHMTCWKCKCHMCWLCLKVFPEGKLVYDHQAVCPNRYQNPLG